jgi:hypothetical protein
VRSESGCKGTRGESEKKRHLISGMNWNRDRNRNTSRRRRAVVGLWATLTSTLAMTMTMMMMIVLVLDLSSSVKVVSSASSEAKVGQIEKALKASDPRKPLSLSTSTFLKWVSDTPRNYTFFVVLTAMGSEFGCKPCHEFESEFGLISAGWANEKVKGRAYFGVLDFADGKEIFGKVTLSLSLSLSLLYSIISLSSLSLSLSLSPSPSLFSSYLSLSHISSIMDQRN